MIIEKKKLKAAKIIWSVILAVVWTAVIALLILFNGDITVENFLDYRPDNMFLAVLCIMGLYCLKSMDFLMHCGVLYALSSIVFPLPVALLINFIGTVIFVTPSYWLGHSLGVPVRDHLLEQYPKLQTVNRVKLRNNWVRVMLIRFIGPPILMVNLYMGADECPFKSYMAGSMIGLIPQTLCFSIMGMKIKEPGSTEFIIALAVQILEVVASIVVYYILIKKQKKEDLSK